MDILKTLVDYRTDVLNKIDGAQKEIEALPKGSVQYKTVHKKAFPYLVYLDEATGKIKTVYIKAAELPALETKLIERKALREKIKELKKELAYAERLLNVKPPASIL